MTGTSISDAMRLRISPLAGVAPRFDESRVGHMQARNARVGMRLAKMISVLGDSERAEAHIIPRIALKQPGRGANADRLDRPVRPLRQIVSPRLSEVV